MFTFCYYGCTLIIFMCVGVIVKRFAGFSDRAPTNLKRNFGLCFDELSFHSTSPLKWIIFP